MFTAQAMLLAGPRGRRSGTLYATGAVVTLLTLVGAMVFLGQVISLPTKLRLSSSLDIAFGMVLLIIALLIFWQLWVRPAGKPESTAGPARSAAKAALPFGVFSMLTNVTTLALMVPAAKDITVADTGLPGRIVLIFVLVALAAAPAWVPVALTVAAPGPGTRVLSVINRLTTRWSRPALVVVFAAAGLFFFARGCVRLLT